MRGEPNIIKASEEQVRRDASDWMQHSTTSDLSARLMCRVGFRELTRLLAHYDQLKRVHAARSEPRPKPEFEARAEALLGEAVESLRPFAEAADVADDEKQRDTCSAWESPLAASVEYGHFRAASAFLQKVQGSSVERAPAHPPIGAATEAQHGAGGGE